MKASPAGDDAMDLERVLEMFDRAHLSNDSLATDLPVWHREVWAGTYRQLLTGRLAADSGAARPG